MPNGISFLDKGIIPSISPFPSIGDFNNDGWLEPFGLINDGQGGLLTGPSGAIQSILNNYPDRTPRDVRLLDIDGDSNLDAIWNVYSDPLLQGSFTLILYGDGQGGISRTEERRDIAGFGETIVAADFNNDGTSDVFIPVYTHVYGSDSSFLLFNQSGVLGPNVALEWGVGLGNQPGFLRVEGAQGADVNFDGFIDLYTAGHLFLNDGSQFADALAAAPPFDEGGSLIDFDNDGDFDLALRLENGSVELYEWTGNAFQSHGLLTAGNSFPGFGIKTFDIDGNGWEDIVFGHSLGTSALLNFGGTFQRVDISGVEFYATAFADIDKDGRIDIIGGASTGNMVYLQNQSIVGDSLEIAVLGALGEQDQFGRSVRLSPVDAPSVVMARAVESGSGYLSQSQYNLIVGLPVAGEYRVEVTFANGPLTFSASAGQRVEAFADGHVLIAGSAGNDIFGGGDGADFLLGNAGDDIVRGSHGADIIDAGTGVDVLNYGDLDTSVDIDLSASAAMVSGAQQSISGVEDIVGSAYSDQITGDKAANRIYGGAGDDIIDGLGGVDELNGERGNDIYAVEDASATVIELANEGLDEVRTGLAAYTLPDNVEILTGTSLTGQALTGNDGDNLLSGGPGTDIFSGGLGNDVYLVGPGDQVIEAVGAGIDEIRANGASFALADNVENLVGTNAVGQQLIGNALDNMLSGSTGADLFSGGQGDDSYVVDAGDVIVENAGEGIDQVSTSLLSYALPNNVENVRGTATAGQEFFGNDLSNRLEGGSGPDRFHGGLGDDVYYVSNGDAVFENAAEGIDSVVTSLASYTLIANVENVTGTSNLGQKLVGNSADNIFVSGTGPNTLIGLAGNDSYFVNSQADLVTESPSGGQDTIYAGVNYTLYDGSEVEGLSAADTVGTAPLALEGNYLANTLTGNDGANILDGAGGADKLYGLGGNDVFVIDNAADQVFEADQGGFDTVFTTVNFSLGGGAFVEQLIARDITTTYALNLTGNANANTLIGNDGTNVLDGAGGADKLYGLGGNDVFDGGAGNDTLDAGAGDDRIVQTGSTDGRDFVDGGAGTDTYVLTGDAASEAFTIYTRAAFAAAFPTDALNAATEIVVVRNGVVITELDNIEEIRIDTFDVSANDGNGTPNGGSNGGDTITIVGDFTQTSLDYSTIRINGSAGNDTVDISSLTSAHRIIFSSNGGQDVILGDLRPQDIIVEDPSQGDGVASDSVSSWHTNIEADGLQSDWGRVTGALEEFAIPAQYLPVAASSRAHADNPSLAFNTEESIDVSGQGLDQPQALVWPGEHVDTHGWLQFMADHGHAIF